ncbi:MAG: IgA Peptidase M64 [Clostridium sp.]|nr:IgA Peptidase M64 [Clostridium sp.]
MTLLFLCSCIAGAQDFEDNFTDRTLRADYTFSGNSSVRMVSLDGLSVSEGWYGKRRNLPAVPVEGNGQIIVRKHRGGDVIYRNSFSTLFQEWLSYDEAKEKSRSFENVFLMPMPKDTVDVTVRLMDSRREVMAEMTHTVVPDDILIRRLAVAGTTPYETLQHPADTSRCIRIAFVAEGYREEEMPVFIDDANAAAEALFAHEPFKSRRRDFGIVAVKSPSADSGTSEPGKGKWLNTALHSGFDTFYSERYLTTLHLKDLHDWLAGIPYEHIIVLVNTDRYGGGGILNSYNLAATRHPQFRPVAVHEFGHSFAGLADEYAYETEDIPMYPLDVEPWEKNITTDVDFSGKWENLIGKVPGVGKFEGAGYSLKGVYRASRDCRMRTNENPEFCPACRQAIEGVIKFYTE